MRAQEPSGDEHLETLIGASSCSCYSANKTLDVVLVKTGNKAYHRIHALDSVSVRNDNKALNIVDVKAGRR